MKKLFCIFLLILPTFVNASSTLSGKTVNKVHVNLNSGVYFTTDQAMENPDGCNSSVWYHLLPNSAYEKEALSILLSAKMSGKKIQFYLSDCNSGYPAVYYINVSD
jgi:hypothetical protein